MIKREILKFHTARNPDSKVSRLNLNRSKPSEDKFERRAIWRFGCWLHGWYLIKIFNFQVRLPQAVVNKISIEVDDICLIAPKRMFGVYQNSIIFPIVNLIYGDSQFLVDIINLNNMINKPLLAAMSYELESLENRRVKEVERTLPLKFP